MTAMLDRWTKRNARLVPPGAVVDDTTAPRWTPVRVEVVLAQPVVGLPRDQMHLDGPLSWAAYLAYQEDPAMPELPELTSEWAVDFALPLATWTAPCTRDDPDSRLLADDGTSVWGWACSRAHYRVLRYDVAHVRRKPALEEMAYWTTAGKHHIGLGPRRAANVPHQAAWVDRLRWWALADPARLVTLLGRLHNVGRLPRHGWGQILTITVAEDPEAADRWQDRDRPHPQGRPATIRAPYWHRSREMSCR